MSQSLLSISLVMHWLGSDLDPGKALLSGQSGRRICIFLHTRHFGNLIKCCCYPLIFSFFFLLFILNLMTKFLVLLKNVEGLNLKVNLSLSRGLRQNLICSRLKLSKCAIAIPQAAHLLLNLWHFVNPMQPNFPR